jgi:hypothetical protein
LPFQIRPEGVSDDEIESSRLQRHQEAFPLPKSYESILQGSESFFQKSDSVYLLWESVKGKLKYWHVVGKARQVNGRLRVKKVMLQSRKVMLCLILPFHF